MSESDNKQEGINVPQALEAEIVRHSVDAKSGGKKNYVFALSQTAAESLEKSGYKSDDPSAPLMLAIEQATGNANKKAPSLAFAESPSPSENYHGLFKIKRQLLPDEVLKQIRVSDHLVAAILRARGGQVSLFGHLRKDRFDVGIEVKIKKEFYKILTPEQYQQVSERMKRVEALLLNCGHTEGVENQNQMTLAEFLDEQVRNGLTFGRFATEIIYDRSQGPDLEGNYPFHRFRPVDVATIFRAVRKGDALGENFRQEAMKAIMELNGEKGTAINLAMLEADQYAWIQRIDGLPRQAFTHKEMLVFNLFPSTDVEHNGYPVSPMDTAVSSITTHISIDAYKKLYFQNGRASKGMLVIKSDEVDEPILNGIKAQFNASINNVGNSFRTPIFGMGAEDDVQWVSMNDKMGDDDFQFMYDQVARNILSSFSMAPDELPGYAHLSRGTNSQTLSESNNEFKLTAARDTGLRPLILKLKTFLNQRLFPIIDATLSKICEIDLVGLDAQSKEQESTRLQQDMPTHMTMDDVLHEVDKDQLGRVLGGKFPFNERWQLVADKMLNVGQLKGALLDHPGAYVDPILRYLRDPFFLQNLQLLAQVNPAAVQAYFAPRPFAMELLKMCVQDSIEEEDNARD